MHKLYAERWKAEDAARKAAFRLQRSQTVYKVWDAYEGGPCRWTWGDWVRCEKVSAVRFQVKDTIK